MTFFVNDFFCDFLLYISLSLCEYLSLVITAQFAESSTEHNWSNNKNIVPIVIAYRRITGRPAKKPFNPCDEYIPFINSP